MSTFIHSETPKQLHAYLALEIAQPDSVRDSLIHDFHAAMLATVDSLSAEAMLATQELAMALSNNHRMLLLRADVGFGKLAFGDYGRNVTSLIKAGLAEEGHDFQGAPVTFLTRSGQRYASSLQRYARELERGLPYSRHFPSNAPSARAHEQNALWGENAAFQGDVVTPDGVKRAWSNRHVALLFDSTNAQNNKHLPLSQSPDNAKNIQTVDIQRIWPKDLEGRSRKPVVPVAISGTLAAEAKTLTDSQIVWLSNGQTLDSKYVDAVLRIHPNARFSYDPHEARQGAITISVPDAGTSSQGDKSAERIVGILMGTVTGKYDNMPAGVFDALNAYWEAKGVPARVAAVERAMEESLRALRGHQVSYLCQDRSHNLILRGEWVEPPNGSLYLKLHWDSVDNKHLHETARHQNILLVGPSSMASGTDIRGLDAASMTARWKREAFVANITADGEALKVTDALGFASNLTSLDAFQKYRRDHGLPEWFAYSDLQELAYRHTGRGSHAFSTKSEIQRPPVEIGQRVRWTPNAPDSGLCSVVEGQVIQCEQSHTGSWRLTLRYGVSPTDGQALNTKVWSHLGTVQDAGWSLVQDDHARSFLVEPSGQRLEVRSAIELAELTEAIAIRDVAMLPYVQGLVRQWWQSRTLTQYVGALDQVLNSQYGITVEDCGEEQIRFEQERTIGNAPATVAFVLGDKLGLAPIDTLSVPSHLAQTSTVSTVPAPITVQSPQGSVFGKGNAWTPTDSPTMH